MSSRTKTNPVVVFVAGVLLVAGGWFVYNMAQHANPRAADSVSQWAEPKRMTKPTRSDRPRHTVKFIVEALPARVLNVHAKAGVAQSMGPVTIEAGRWSWTARGVATGEYAELNVEEASKERGALRCWITVDGKLYRVKGQDDPYDVIWDTRTRQQCWGRVIVG